MSKQENPHRNILVPPPTIGGYTPNILPSNLISENISPFKAQREQPTMLRIRERTENNWTNL